METCSGVSGGSKNSPVAPLMPLKNNCSVLIVVEVGVVEELFLEDKKMPKAADHTA
ncbi:hypothetical protein CWATWH0005_1398 [Crocosphaera watsonii WH 0005]|uniref:Uncharacterized protein n=1 Tax=Crocosphaera watsonii WH 0005 TaxID=423472 RepID=T2IXK7_CROWT|nr:hypothetical protein CWATWH0005_1398 [Crocosphaera watsonii WH 0005]